MFLIVLGTKLRRKVDFQERASVFEIFLKNVLLVWLQTPPCWWQSFSALLQSSVTHDLLEIILTCWLAARETFIIIINVENSCCLIVFWKMWYTFFRIFDDYKEHSFEIQIFINVFTVTFDKMNASLLNKSIHFLYTVVYFFKSSHPEKIQIKFYSPWKKTFSLARIMHMHKKVCSLYQKMDCLFPIMIWTCLKIHHNVLASTKPYCVTVRDMYIHLFASSLTLVWWVGVPGCP